MRWAPWPARPAPSVSGPPITVVPTAGHLLHYEAPDEVADVVGDFLERLG